MQPMTARKTWPLLTADRMAEDSRYHDCELWDGMPMVKEASGGYSAFSGAQLAGLLWPHVRERNLGWVGGADVGFVLRRNPDRMLSPDAAFISFAKLAEPPRKGFAECVPDFVVEVRSPDQTWREIVAKGVIWSSHGVPVVWLLDPEMRTLVTMRPGEGPVELGPGDIVSAAPALPEFSVLVDDLFRPLGPRRQPS